MAEMRFGAQVLIDETEKENRDYKAALDATSVHALNASRPSPVSNGFAAQQQALMAAFSSPLVTQSVLGETQRRIATARVSTNDSLSSLYGGAVLSPQTPTVQVVHANAPRSSAALVGSPSFALQAAAAPIFPAQAPAAPPPPHLPSNNLQDAINDSDNEDVLQAKIIELQRRMLFVEERHQLLRDCMPQVIQILDNCGVDLVRAASALTQESRKRRSSENEAARQPVEPLDP